METQTLHVKFYSLAVFLLKEVLITAMSTVMKVVLKKEFQEEPVSEEIHLLNLQETQDLPKLGKEFYKTLTSTNSSCNNSRLLNLNYTK